MTVGISLGFPGVSRVLEESEKLKLLHFHPLLSADDELLEDDTYILGAWHPAYLPLLTRLKGKRIGVLWTSSLGEMSLEPSEIQIFQFLLDDPLIDFIWCGSKALHKITPKVFYAPYPMTREGYGGRAKEDTLALFCPQTGKKNALNQLLAAQRVHEGTYTIHTNLAVPSFLRLGTLRLHSWLPRPELEAIVGAARLSFCASFSETFNYQSAESILMGTPCVGSATIPFLPSPLVRDLNSPLDIRLTAERILDSAEAFLQKQRESLGAYISDHNADLREVLMKQGIIR